MSLNEQIFVMLFKNRRFTIRLNNVLWLFLQLLSFALSVAAPGLCRGRVWVGGRGLSGQSACGLSETPECLILWWFWTGDDFSAPCYGELRGAPAWWCGTEEGSGPQHGRPDGATAQSDSAQFLAASLEPAQLLPGSVETGASRHVWTSGSQW